MIKSLKMTYTLKILSAKYLKSQQDIDFITYPTLNTLPLTENHLPSGILGSTICKEQHKK